MSVERRSRRLIVRLYLFPLLASVAILVILAFGAGVMARPLFIPDPPPEFLPANGKGGIPEPTPTPFGPTATTPEPPPTATPFVVPYEPYILLLASSIPLRSGPGIHFPTLAQGLRDQGYFLLGISVDSQWWAVQLFGVPGNMAWVERHSTMAYNATGLPVITAYDPLPGVHPIPGKGHLLIVVESIIREGPGVTYVPIQDAVPGEWFRVAGESADGLWLAVSLDGLSSRLGWVRADAGYLY